MSQARLIDDELPTHELARAAIAQVLKAAPTWLGAPEQKRVRLTKYARAEVDSKERSRRWEAARAALFAIKHHDSLLKLDAALADVPGRFSADREEAAGAVKRCESACAQLEADAAEAAGRHAQAARSYQAQYDKLHEAHNQAKLRLESAQQVLKNSIHGDDESATDKAAAAVAKAKKDLDEATTALASGPMAEVLQAKFQRAEATKAEAASAAQRLADARAALLEAQEQLVQLDIDASLVEVTDRIVDAWFRFGRVGSSATGKAPELVVAGVDEQRAPLTGSGMEGLLSILYSPNYDALEVDLSELADGNEVRTAAPNPYFEEALTRAANRVQFFPDVPARPGDRPVSVSYSDPTMDPKHGITRVAG